MSKNKKFLIENIFTSKSDVLKTLQPNLKFSKIEKLYFFKVSMWNQNKKKILNEITKNFCHSNKIIVRSSAIGEDSFESSQAGSYESILNVDPKSNSSLNNAINLVLKSYKKEQNFNKHNQILIQNQTSNIVQSGVVFTRMRDGSPYYVINFEDGSSTVGVTQGKVGNLIKIFRKSNVKNIPKKWRLLIKSVKEIEKLISNTYLDIEFGITSSYRIIIFQVRPLISENVVLDLDNKIKNEIKSIQKKYEQYMEKFSSIKPIFSDMADWNPSEIIGSNPNFLDYSLYDFLIMNKSWYLGRKEIGYKIPTSSKLMIKFGNKPYVNTLLSFISFTPNKLSKKTTLKLLKFYNCELKLNPHLHDKIEFDIVFTCFDLAFDERLNKVFESGFSKNEIKEIRNVFLEFTNKIINDFSKISTNSCSKIQTMSKNRDNIKKNLSQNNFGFSKKLNIIEVLLNDCKQIGALEFSKMARIAFISTIILKSMIKTSFISEKIANSILNSIETPLSKFQLDLTDYFQQKISKRKFLSKYGHLRPGTYDITQSRYDQNDQFLDKIQFHSNSKSIKIPTNKINKVLQKNGIDTSSVDFIDFLKKSLTYREDFKFEFTKNLSDILELIYEIGSDFNLSREELSNLDLETILYSKKISKLNAEKLWRKKIISNKKQKQICNYLNLPPLILEKNNFNIVKYYSAHPNFITDKSITSKIFFLNEKSIKKQLKNKIIVLENADPGYDWIFSYNLSGLITKYGGVASHMSIRCSEIGLPAAIGCGEIIYENLLESSKVVLDCKNNEILILEHSKNNQFLEERKVLKSLGYIK